MFERSGSVPAHGLTVARFLTPPANRRGENSDLAPAKGRAP